MKMKSSLLGDIFLIKKEKGGKEKKEENLQWTKFKRKTLNLGVNIFLYFFMLGGGRDIWKIVWFKSNRK